MNVLVLGASGYVGGILSTHLKGAGHRVVVSMRTKPKANEKWLAQFDKSVLGDPFDKKIQIEISQESYDAVIFAIAMDYQDQKAPLEQVLETNVGLLWKYLDLFADKIRTLIYFSTQKVYGPFGPEMHEDQICRPGDINALTHHLAEHIGEYFANKSALRVYNLRLSNMFGAPAYFERKFLRFAVTELCHQAVISGRIQLKSDGSQIRDFIHAADVCQAVDRLLTHAKSQSHSSTYNLGSGVSYSIREVASAIQTYVKDVENQAVEIVGPGGAPLPYSSTTAKHFHYDISRLRALGYAPKGDLRLGIAETFSYLRRFPR